MAKPRIRVDQLLVNRGLAPSRARAQAMVLAGTVYVGDTRVEKAGATVADDAPIVVRGADHPYVSRGGVKLEGALDAFGVRPTDLRCLDLGASTGGFTDCLLQRGARAVIAVDVGYGQLAHKLRVDPRVVVMERTNARTLTAESIGGAVDLTVVDASFIGIDRLTEAIARVTREGGELVALVKPQFEVGREEATRTKGVVRDDAVREQAIAGAVRAIEVVGFDILGQCDSVLPGPKGNREAFVHARRSAPCSGRLSTPTGP
ncbi:TlyA family RNA methyltransferase [Pendulispora albinea]|uniref:TlyA family RNA methyltransferase n=1 Tax=Pendulispora albinea TaxID=2741071 RepID=A0ABZ2M014_9BACT